MSMLEAICPQCGIHYCGWALQTLAEPRCNKCGVPLELVQESANPPRRHSNFEAKELDEDARPR